MLHYVAYLEFHSTELGEVPCNLQTKSMEKSLFLKMQYSAQLPKIFPTVYGARSFIDPNYGPMCVV
jgi:hypothetical protein